MNLDVFYKGKFKYTLNSALVQRNSVTSEKVEKIKKLHVKKLEIFEEMEKEESKEMLKAYANLIETIEYELQTLWGFNKDRTMHEWYNVPKCRCPKSDNSSRQGTTYKVIIPNCPIHGK